MPQDTTPIPTCLSCRWWRREDRPMSRDHLPATGRCRRHPPRVTGVWPNTFEFEGCGEHAPKPEASDNA